MAITYKKKKDGEPQGSPIYTVAVPPPVHDEIVREAKLSGGLGDDGHPTPLFMVELLKNGASAIAQKRVEKERVDLGDRLTALEGRVQALVDKMGSTGETKEAKKKK